MRKSEIEAKALAIIDAVVSGKRVEDSLVEVKADWPSPAEAARRMAGHANASRGQGVFWLVGLDENDREVVGVNPGDFAGWWDQTKSHFDGPIPRVTDVNIFVTPHRLVALLLETDSAPYVVKNPVYGQPGGGPVQLEVPWREMTAVRSAAHSDLIRILVPQLRLPELEVLDGHLSGQGRSDETGAADLSLGPNFSWGFLLVVYVVPQYGSLVIPAHRRTLLVTEAVLGTDVSFLFQQPMRGAPHIVDSRADMVISGPQRVEIRANCELDLQEMPGQSATALLLLHPIGLENKIRIRADFLRPGDNPWRFTLQSAEVDFPIA